VRTPLTSEPKWRFFAALSIVAFSLNWLWHFGSRFQNVSLDQCADSHMLKSSDQFTSISGHKSSS